MHLSLFYAWAWKAPKCYPVCYKVSPRLKATFALPSNHIYSASSNKSPFACCLSLPYPPISHHSLHIPSLQSTVPPSYMHTGWSFVTPMHRTRAPQMCQVALHTLQSTHARVHLNFPSQKCIRPTYSSSVLYCTEALPLWFWCKASASLLSMLASSYSSIRANPRHASASKGVRDTPQTFAP